MIVIGAEPVILILTAAKTASFIKQMVNPPVVGESDADESAAIKQASQERAAQNGGVDPQQAPEPQVSTSGAGARKGGGPKAADAAGVTAGGQATDKHGNKLTGSGKVQVNTTKSNTREKAGNKALNEGSGKVEHRSPKVGNRHFHATNNKGQKKPGSTHHEF